MSSTSIATNGTAGAAVLVACWVATSRYGVVFPEYIVTALVTLAVAASHGVTQLLTRKPAAVSPTP